MMLGKYFKKTVFRKEHTADGVVPEAPEAKVWMVTVSPSTMPS